MSTYRFHMPPARSGGGPLPEGDYGFVVANVEEPYIHNVSGNLVLPLKLTIEPHGVTVFHNPWKGTTRDGEERDGIADFLLAVDKAPPEGMEPNWNALVGAKGRCHLKVELATKGSYSGKEVNKVAWFITPRQLPAAKQWTKEELEAFEAEVRQKQGGDEPDEIPF